MTRQAFYRWFAQRPHAQAVLRDIENVAYEDTEMDQWEAQILARVMCKASCWIVTGDVNEALREAQALLGETAGVTVTPDGVGVIVEKEEPQ